VTSSDLKVVCTLFYCYGSSRHTDWLLFTL